MHPLRVLLIVSLGLAMAIAGAFGALLVRAGTSTLEATVLALLVFVAYLVPWGGVSMWAWRRASDLDRLIDRTRRVVERGAQEIVADRTYHGELDELARSIDAVRQLLQEQGESLAEHRAAVDQIVGALGEGLMAVRPDGRIAFANARLAEMFGAEGTLAGRSILEVVRKRAVVDAIGGALRGEATVGRVVAQAKNGERQIEVRTVPLKSSSEIAAVALFIDVSDLERLQKIRSEFLEDFSHEIRTPLAGLRSAAETLEGGRLTPEHEEALRQVIRRQLHRIERLVLDIAELNRIESGALILEKKPVDLRELIADVAGEMRGNVPLVFRGEPATAMADPVRLQQVFSNLLDNAGKHGGGEVVVEIIREGPSAVVRVLDNGEGIPSADLERIFNRFYRIDRSRSQDVPGLGLGLAIAKHLVKLHDGEIRAFNRPQGGAGFEVRLPAG